MNKKAETAFNIKLNNNEKDVKIPNSNLAFNQFQNQGETSKTMLSLL